MIRPNDSNSRDQSRLLPVIGKLRHRQTAVSSANRRVTGEPPSAVSTSSCHHPVPESEIPTPDERDPPTGDQDAEDPTVIRKVRASDHQVPEAESTNARGTSPPAPPDRSPTAVAKVLLGKHLNQFRLDKMIGGGGMGAVFRAHDEQLDRVVAVKVIPFVGDDPELQRRFRNEAQSAARLDHPRIAKVFETGSDDRWHYIVFEYIEGINIRDLVQREGVLSIDEAVYFTMQLADALGHAGQRGITHRDIKPSNIVISDGRIKLVDMGLARSDRFDFSQDMTASGVTLGTFDYISPEQAKDPRDADIRSDLYSLGCTLFFMLTGSPPYPGGTMLQKLLAHGSNPPPEIREQRREVSETLSGVLTRMLAKQPSDRYQTANALVADLKRVAISDGLRRSRNVGTSEANADAFPSENRLPQFFETHLPWLVATGLLLTVAGFLQIQAMVTKQTIVIPPTAAWPRLTTNRDSGLVLNAPQVPGAPSNPDAVSRSSSSDVPTDQPDESDMSSTPQFGDPRLPPKFSVGPARTGTAPATPNGFAVSHGSGLSNDSARSNGSVRSNDSARSNDSMGNSMDPRGDGFNADSNPSNADDLSEVLQSGRVTSLLVTGQPTTEGSPVDPQGRLLVPSLASALDIAAQHEIAVVEIGVPILQSPPVRISGNEILIRSAVGHSTIEWVAAPVEGQASDSSMVESVGNEIDSIDNGFDTIIGGNALGRSATFCEVSANQTEVQNIHFVWQVPNDTIDGGTLFDLSESPLFSLKDCAITISNTAMRNSVFAFRVSSLADGSTPATQSATQLDLNNVIVRGEASMIDLKDQSRFDLNWYNGLLAITGTMVESNGTPQIPAPNDAITLSFVQVTLDPTEGMMVMRLGRESYPIRVSRSATKSVFTLNPRLPPFEFIGLQQLGRSGQWLRLQGASNAFDAQPTRNEPLLRLRTRDDSVQTTRVNELADPQIGWIQETLPRLSVRWSSSDRSLDSPSRRTPSDYRQNGASTLVGFDETLLPPLDRPTGVGS